MSSIAENKKYLFVVPQLAIKAANKGYVDKYPIAHYVKGSNGNGDEFENWTLYFGGGTFFASDFDKHIPAPTYAEIVDWFRGKHSILIKIDPCELTVFYAWIRDCRNGKNKIVYDSPLTNDYYEALNKAIERAFELI